MKFSETCLCHKVSLMMKFIRHSGSTIQYNTMQWNRERERERERKKKKKRKKNTHTKQAAHCTVLLCRQIFNIMAVRHKLLNALSLSTDKLSRVHKLFKFSLYNVFINQSTSNLTEFYAKTRKRAKCECIATWGRPPLWQLFSAIFVHFCTVHVHKLVFPRLRSKFWHHH